MVSDLSESVSLPAVPWPTCGAFSQYRQVSPSAALGEGQPLALQRGTDVHLFLAVLPIGLPRGRFLQERLLNVHSGKAGGIH